MFVGMENCCRIEPTDKGVDARLYCKKQFIIHVRYKLKIHLSYKLSDKS